MTPGENRHVLSDWLREERMMMNYLVHLLGPVLINAALLGGQSAYDDAMKGLRNVEISASEGTLRKLGDAIFRSVGEGREVDTAIQELLAVANDGEVGGNGRGEAMRIAILLAEAPQAKEVASTLVDLVLDTRPGGGHRAFSYLIRQGSLIRLLEKSPDDIDIFQPLLTYLARDRVMFPADFRKQCENVLLLCDVPELVWADGIDALILAGSINPVVGIGLPFLPRIDSNTLQRVVQAARERAETGEVSTSALVVLAHFGDRTALDLTDLWPGVRRDPNGISDTLTFMINHQEKDVLLRHIEGVNPPGMRTWALRKAVEVGVDREELRGAVLTHGQKASNNGKTSENRALIKASIEIGLFTRDEVEANSVVAPETSIRR